MQHVHYIDTVRHSRAPQILSSTSTWAMRNEVRRTYVLVLQSLFKHEYEYA